MANERDNDKVATAKHVTVACKHPAGIILQLQQKVTRRQPLPGGGNVEIEEWEKIGPQVKLNGFAIPRGPDLNPDNIPQISGGFALTHGVDAEFFRKWMDQNKDSDIVKNGLVFAAENPTYAADKAKERKKDVVSGLEPLAQDKDYRAPAKVQKADVGNSEAA